MSVPEGPGPAFARGRRPPRPPPRPPERRTGRGRCGSRLGAVSARDHDDVGAARRVRVWRSIGCTGFTPGRGRPRRRRALMRLVHDHRLVEGMVAVALDAELEVVDLDVVPDLRRQARDCEVPFRTATVTSAGATSRASAEGPAGPLFGASAGTRRSRQFRARPPQGDHAEDPRLAHPGDQPPPPGVRLKGRPLGRDPLQGRPFAGRPGCAGAGRRRGRPRRRWQGWSDQRALRCRLNGARRPRSRRGPPRDRPRPGPGAPRSPPGRPRGGRVRAPSSRAGAPGRGAVRGRGRPASRRR